MGEATVSRLLRARKERGAALAVKGKDLGAKPSLGAEDIAALVGWVGADPQASWRSLRRRMEEERGVKVSDWTLRRHYSESGGVRKGKLALLAKSQKGPATRTGFTEKHRRTPQPKGDRRGYPSDLTDAEWELLEPELRAAGVGQPRSYRLRDVVDALRYQTRTGCAWRYLPTDLPPWNLVHRYYSEWRHSGLFERVHQTLREKVRVAQGRSEQPSAAIIDSQTAKSAGAVEDVGYDAGKKANGRKRHILVDMLGLILLAVVHGANIQDREGATLLLNDELTHRFPSVEVVYADRGYAGKLEDEVNAMEGVRMVIVARNAKHAATTAEAPKQASQPSDPDVSTQPAPATAANTMDSSLPSDSQALPGSGVPEDKTSGFKVLPKRWIVERTFGWLVRCRRLARDYEVTADSSSARLLIASAGLMLAQLGVG
jgi:transposase